MRKSTVLNDAGFMLRVSQKDKEILLRIKRGALYEIHTINGPMLVKVTHFYKTGIRCQALSRPETTPTMQRKLDFTVPYPKVSRAQFKEKKYEDVPLYMGHGTNRMTRFFKEYTGPYPF
jgi:hypothetical protein